MGRAGDADCEGDTNAGSDQEPSVYEERGVRKMIKAVKAMYGDDNRMEVSKMMVREGDVKYEKVVVIEKRDSSTVLLTFFDNQLVQEIEL